MALRASIRVHLLRLVLSVAVPLAALLAWNLYESAQADMRHAREHVFQLAQITASDTAKFLARAHDALNRLAARAAVNALDPERCDPIMADFHALSPRFANVVTMTLDGRVVCSARPFKPGTHGNPDRFIKLMRGPGELTVGKAAPGVVTGKWVVPIGRPLLDPRGRIVGAVVLPVDLVNLPLSPSVASTAPNSVVGLIDLDGTLLARSREPARYVGTSLADSVAIRERNGSAEVEGVDGFLWISGFTPVQGTNWIAFVSMPASEIYAGIRARTVTSVLIAVGALCIAVLFAVRWSRAIAEPMTALAAASRSVGGNSAARGPVIGAAEIAEAARQFTLLFDSRARATAELRASEARLADVIASAMDAIVTVNEQQEILIFNPAAEKMFGCARADMIGNRLDALIPERFRAAHRGHVEKFGKAGITNRAIGKLSPIIGLRADGVEFPIEASISQIGESPGKLFTVILRDVTGRQLAEESLRASLVRQRKLLQRLQETGENERRRINRELHDRIGQGLSMLSLNLDLIRAHAPPGALQAVGTRIDDAQALVSDTTAQIRNLMADLHPPALDDFGVLAALQSFCATLAARTGVAIAVSGSEPVPRLPRTVEMALFRIAEAALGNSIKHAQASRIDTTLAVTAARVTLTVADDGKGFEPGEGTGTPHWGLTIMRERAEAVGIDLRVESSPGQGTRVIAEAMRKAA